MWIRLPLISLVMVACDRDGSDFVPQPDPDHPGVLELGELAVIEPSELSGLTPEACGDTDGERRCIYAQVGTSSSDVQGGVTYTFLGTGEPVCLIVDPEAVFWNQSISPTEPDPAYGYPDNPRDDGDIDMFAGLSSYYNGSPGVELGDFEGIYTDSLGNSVTIEYGECNQTGRLGQDDAHGGRGAPEYCQIATSGREGVQFTVVLKTFSTPLDDGVMSFAAVAVNGKCRELGIDECTLADEALDPESGAPRDGYAGLEAAFCNNEQATYCCDNPDMCGDDPPVDFCESISDTAGE